MATTSIVELRQARVGDGIDVWSMIQEIGGGENGFHNGGHGTPFSRFDDFVARLADASRGVGLAEGHVPQTTFWAYVGTRPIGIVKVRHRLTDALRITGGHIGYSIRPSDRGRRYGAPMLRAGLDEAAKLGIAVVLITVNDDNDPSWRMVESNNGRLVKVADGKRYYEVATGR